MFPGSQATGAGRKNPLTSFGSAECGGICHQAASGRRDIGARRKVSGNGHRATGQTRPCRRCPIYQSRRDRSNRVQTSILPREITFGSRVHGSLAKSATLGDRAIGRMASKTGAGLLLTINGRHAVIFSLMATGTMIFPVVVWCSHLCVSTVSITIVLIMHTRHWS